MPVEFDRQVAPFLTAFCVGCHDGGDDSKGGLNLLSYEALMEGGNSGAVVVPGKPAESLLVKLLLGKEKPRMPPADSRQPKPEEIERIVKWVEGGAKGASPNASPATREITARPVPLKVAVSAPVAAVAQSADGKWLAAAQYQNVLLFDARSLKLLRTLEGAKNPMNGLAFDARSARLAAAEGQPGVAGALHVWDLATFERQTLAGHADSIYGVQFSADGQTLLSYGYDRVLITWDLQLGKPKQTLKSHTGAVFGAAYSPDGNIIASVSADQTIKLWNAASGARLLTLTEPTKGLYAVAFHPRGQELAAAGIDKMIRLYEWNGTQARLKRASFAHDASILALAYSPDGATLYSSSEDRRIKAWDAAEMRETRTFEDLPDWPLAMVPLADGAQLAVGFYHGELVIYDTHGGNSPRTLISSARQLAQAVATPAAPLAAANSTTQEPGQPNPPAPRLDGISPRTAVRGGKAKLTLAGQNIWNADRIDVSPGHLPLTMLPGDAKNPNQLLCELDLPADMSIGQVSLRVHTPLGSAGTRSFYVGPFSEVAEAEPNNAAAQATPVALPSTLTGTISARGDQDHFHFEAASNEELVFVLVGANFGSSLNARMQLLDADGRRLESATRSTGRAEVVLGARFDRAGKYTLRIEDRDNTGGGNHFYHVHAGRFGWVTQTFPLAMRGTDQAAAGPHEVASVNVRGFNLPNELSLPTQPGTGTRFVVPEGPAGKALNAARYELSSMPEYSEAEPNDRPLQAQLLPVPGAVSGRVAPWGTGAEGAAGADADCFAFEARQGQRLTLEVQARRVGSPLDSVIEVLDAQGSPVARHTLRSVSETYTELRDHDSRSKGIRLHNWEDLKPNDFVMLGGEVVRVHILPLGPDEDVKFFDKGGLRLGYLGTTPEAHALNSNAYKVEVHPPGREFPPNGMPVVRLDYRNDDGGPSFGADSQLLFDAPADGRYIVRLRDVRGLQGEEFVYRLIARERQEDFRISIDPENPNVPRGGSLPVTVNIERLDGFNGYVDVRLEGLPEGFTATSTRIGPDLYTGVLTITAAATAEQPNQEAGRMWKAIGTAQIGAQTVAHASTPGFGSHVLSVASAPDLLVQVEPRSARISPGQELRFTVSIERRNGFTGRVPVDVLNLPLGLRVLDVGLNGVLINEDETSRSFVVTCDPWAAPGLWPFYAAPKVEAKNERHASDLLMLEVVESQNVAGK
jgi:WD40 repeat protein